MDITGILHIANILHIVGTILGFGGAIAAAIIMLRLRTDEQRLRRGQIAKRISSVTWCGYILLVISGIILTLNFEFWYTWLFGAKHLLTAVLLVDALFIHFRYFPRYFRQLGTPEFNKTYATMRRIGILSVTCWVIILVISLHSMTAR
ncbi:MAG: hypothetical protein MUO89_07315 [Dehalococcoidia bacterium]|nr:hypothetical protein [Dehalococcoidia bacterium]